MSTRFLAFALVMAVVGCSPRSHRPVELGHVSVGMVGESEQRGIALAIDEIDSNPERRPGERAVIVRHASGGKTSDELVGQFARLLSLNRVRGLLGPIGPDSIDRVAALAQGEQTIVISTSGWIGESTPSNVFALGASPQARAQALAVHVRETVQKLPESERTIVVIREPSAIVAGRTADRLVSECRSLATIRQVEALPAGETGMVIAATTPGKLAELRAQTRRPIYFVGSEQDVDSLELSSKANGETLVAVPYDVASPGERLAGFVDRYRAAHHGPPNQSALLAYDAIIALVESARRADGFDAAAMRTQLQSGDAAFELLTGPVRFGTDHHAQRPAVVLRMTPTGLVRANP